MLKLKGGLLSRQNQVKKTHIEILKNYAKQGEWEKILSKTDEGVRDNDLDAESYYWRGKAFLHIKSVDQALESFKRTIEFETKRPIKSCFKEIEDQCFNADINVQTKHVYLGGKNNLGMFEHTVLRQDEKPQKFITKILYGNQKREIHFYQKVIQEYTFLKQLVPESIYFGEIGGLFFITMKKIDGKTLNAKKLWCFLSFYNKISEQIPYTETLDSTLKTPLYGIKLKAKKTQGIVNFFSKIHEEESFYNLMTQMQEKLNRNHYPYELKVILLKIEEMVMKGQLHKAVDPKKHYCFNHGDLSVKNVLDCSLEGKFYILDWNSFKTAPRWYDTLYLAVKSHEKWEHIKKQMESEDIFSHPLEDIEKIYFWICFILLKFWGKSPEKYDRSHKEVKKAFKEISKLYAQFKELDPSKVMSIHWKRKKKPAQGLANLMLPSLLKGRDSGVNDLNRAYTLLCLKSFSKKRKVYLLKDLLKSPFKIYKEISTQKHPLSPKYFFLEFYLAMFHHIYPKTYWQQGFFENKKGKNYRYFLHEGILKHCLYNYWTEYRKIKLRCHNPLSLASKENFIAFCKENNLPTVPLLKVVTPDLHGDMKKSLAYEDELKCDLFIKPDVGKEGGGAELWYYQNKHYINHKGKQLNHIDFLKHLIKKANEQSDNKLLVQPLIRPHRDFKCFYRQATPTLRIITYFNECEQISLGPSMFRFNMGSSEIVDNASSGGEISPIILESGTIKEIVLTNPLYTRIPLSEYLKNDKVEVFEIPFFKEAVELAKKAHSLQPCRILIGWDIIISENGPLLLEANSQPGVQYLQAAQSYPLGKNPMISVLAKTTKEAMKFEKTLQNLKKI